MKRLSAILILLALAGCNRSVGDVYQSGVPEAVGYIAGQGDMPVAITGSFYDMPQAEFDALITDMMYGKNGGPLLKFTTTPKPGSTENYTVRLLFGAPDNISHLAMCDVERMPPPVELAETMTVTAAFCYKDRVESGSTGVFHPGKTVDHWALNQLIYRMMMTMFPMVDPLKYDGCGSSVINC